jgi:transcriptional regulator with XRE-family HTH domain
VLSPKRAAAARRVADRAHQLLAEDIGRLRDDAGITRKALAEDAGVDPRFFGRIEDGEERPSIDTYAKIALALGADLGARLYPHSGPRIRDRHQARILEVLLAFLDPRWHAYLEVAVRQPARGWIDALLHAEAARDVVAVEIQSDLRRLEQLLRWIPEKVASLPSWEGWAHLGPTTEASRLLVVRSTRATRDVGRAFGRQLELAYPAHPQDAIASLSGRVPWPGPALVWATIEPERVRFSPRRLR